MSFKIKNQKDFNAGLLFILSGAGFAIVARDYPMGSAVRMGPAYFPTILGWLLVVLGLIVFSRAFFSKDQPPRRTDWRALLLILGSIIAFGLLVEPLKGGLIVASVVLMIMSAYGGEEFKWREAIISGVFLTAICVGTFYYALGLPFQLWPWS
jgi:hypothetical protein